MAQVPVKRPKPQFCEQSQARESWQHTDTARVGIIVCGSLNFEILGPIHDGCHVPSSIGFRAALSTSLNDNRWRKAALTPTLKQKAPLRRQEGVSIKVGKAPIAL
jgi:hypothetical protein